MHLLVLLRRDSIPSFSNTSVGAMMGGGVDLGRGRTRGRLAMDFQIVFEGGEDLKVLRSTLGVRF